MSFVDLSKNSNNIKLKVSDADADGVSSLSFSSLTLASGTMSGQITVTTSGTAVQGSNVSNPGGFYIKAHPDNTDTVWIGNDGVSDVSSSNGYPLNPGEQLVVPITNLNLLWFDADVNSNKICWHKA